MADPAGYYPGEIWDDADGDVGFCLDGETAERVASEAYCAEWYDYSGLAPRRIEFRGSLSACVNWAGKMPRISGPNGPVAGVHLRRPDGSTVEDWAAELERYGLRPLVRRDAFEREYVCGCEVAESTEKGCEEGE
jgi:hypothetical protein